MTEDANVKVFCRVRPPNEREGGAFAASMAGGSSSRSAMVAASSFVKKCIVVPASDPLQQTVFLQSRHASQNSAPKTFTFDRAFGESATQTDVFEIVGVPITQACLQGYNGTIFAYGQTGSGKTFTMQGPDHVIDMDANRLTAQEMGLRGLVPRVFDYLFEDVVAAHDSATNVQHTFACSFLEIYNERVYDLLDGGSTRDPTGLQLRENGRKGVFVEGLIESVVTNAKQAAELMTLGAQNRRVGQTAMNRESSRSHSVFILQIQSKETTRDGITKMRSSRFNLVDLAGSERQRNTEAAGERLKEAGSINKSLSALGNVIMGLVEQSAGKNRHVHYRDSKLTFLLKDSLGGNSKTFMIATISPAEDSAYETLSTLKFAQRAKLIRNNAVINEDSTGSVMVLQEEIQRLRRQLHQAQLESLRIPSEPHLALMAAASPVEMVDASSSSVALTGPCDPAIDSRFRELEAAFATSIEKNGQLKRSHEHLKLQEEHLKALCSEMKRSIAHLKMVLRLRQGKAADDMEKELVDYEPSVDAIEWRLKYEELEENFAELQDEIQQRRMAESFAVKGEGSSGHIEGEIENLNLMLLALTKQLAYVVRDKHELQDRLLRFTKAVADDSEDADMAPSDDQKVAQLHEALKIQAHESNAKVNALLAAKCAAEDKAREASFELLEMKQKEAAWKIQEQERELRLQDALNMLREAEEARARADDLLKQEKQLRQELLLRATQQHDETKLDFESKFADLVTSNHQLLSAHDKLKAEASAVRDERDSLEQQARELSEQIATLQSDLSKSEHMSTEKTLKIDSLGSNLSITTAKLDDAQATIQRGEALVSELRETAASLEDAGESLRKELLGKDEELSTLQSIKDETDRALSHSRAEVSDLQQEKSALTSELEEVSAAFEKIKISHGDLASQLATTTSELAMLRESESTLLNAKAQLEAQVEEGAQSLEESRQELAKQVHDHIQVIKQLKEQAEAKVEQLTTDYEARLEGKADELARLQTSFDDAMRLEEQKQAELQQQHDERVIAMESAKAALEQDYSQTIAGLENELGAKQNEADELGSEVSRLMTELGGIVAKADTLEQQNSELQGIREAQHADLEKSEKDIAALQLSNAELTQTRDSLCGEIEESARALAALQQSKDKLIQTRDELRAEVEQRGVSVEKLSSEIEALNQSLSAAKIREEKLSSDLAAALEQRSHTNEEHSQITADLKAAHADELGAVRQSAEARIAGVERALAEGKQLAQAKEDDIARLESELQALVARHDAENDTAGKALYLAHQDLRSVKKDLEVKTAEYQQKEQALQDAVRSLEADVKRVSGVIQTQQGEIEAYASSAESLKKEIDALKKLGSSQTADHAAELDAARIRVQELERLVETKSSKVIETARLFSDEKRALQKQLKDAEQELTKQNQANKELASKSEGKMKAMESELEQSAEAIRRAKSELSARKAAVAELKTAVAELQSQVDALEKENRGLKQDHQKKADLAALAEQLDSRTSELEKRKSRVAAELKEAEKEKEAAMASRRKLDAVRDDYQQCKMRLEELEPLVIQLKNDKKKLERETQVQSARLENISKENDKLVGHDNKRQKIQYHFKVKEENNRLLGEVRQLTDEKFKLQTKLDKLKLALKEKENFGEAVTLAKRPTPPGGGGSSSSSLNSGAATTSSKGTGATTGHSTVTKKLIPISSGLGLESSSLAPPKPNKKRLHSRIERS